MGAGVKEVMFGFERTAVLAWKQGFLHSRGYFVAQIRLALRALECDLPSTNLDFNSFCLSTKAYMSVDWGFKDRVTFGFCLKCLLAWEAVFSGCIQGCIFCKMFSTPCQPILSLHFQSGVYNLLQHGTSCEKY